MELDENYSRIFKNKLLDTFKYTALFLEKHNLKYWACGGTCIGAVRHKGFIPWDDDIDIMMPRDDYYKLLELTGEIEESGYSLVSIKDKGYYFDFAKLCDSNTTIWEHKTRPFIVGVYIDIYPVYLSDKTLDEIECQIQEYNAIAYKYFRTVEEVTFSDYLYYCSKFDYVRILSSLRSKLLYRNPKKYLKEYLEYEKKLDCPKGDKIVSFIGGYPGHKIYNKEWFDELVDLPFEDTTIKCPNDYDSYLKYVFGDYMKLPPVNQRISDHSKYYINLKEGLTLEEVKQRLKQGEKCVY